MTEVPPSGEDRPSLRTDQVAQTRAALVAAARRLFGRDGFAATSVDEMARQARLTTGALYHHFPNKTALFEAVFEAVHADLLEASLQAAVGAADEVELLTRGFDAFLDAVLEPEVQRIIIIGRARRPRAGPLHRARRALRLRGHHRGAARRHDVGEAAGR